jgi:hypothetical protein
MNMGQVSIGGGLGMVGLGLLALAGAVAVTGSAGVTHADARIRADAPPSWSRPARGGDDGGRRTLSPGNRSGCVTGAPLSWFGSIRGLPDCGFSYGAPTQDGEAADVNGDGRLEYYGDVGATPGEPIATGGVPLPNRPFLSRISSTLESGQTMVAVSSILDTQPLAEWILADQGWTGQIECGFGWNDIDGDRDLDLVVGFISIDPVTWEFLRRQAWVENTGYEATQPLVGDLDGDGSVGASDLTMLLGGWTGN